MIDTPPTSGPYLEGKFLIATPAMGDPRFNRTVVYVCSHDEEQAMGLVINRARKGLTLAALLDQLKIKGDMDEARAGQAILSGGPVETERGFVIHSPEYCDAATSLKVSERIIVSNTKGILTALAGATPPAQSIMALGYAGWSAGQLEGEILQNTWLIADADEAIIFSEDMDTKWSDALANLGIKPESLSGLSGHA